MNTSMAVESAVRSRYAAAAQDREPQLCCPVDYNQEFLRVLREEVIGAPGGGCC